MMLVLHAVLLALGEAETGDPCLALVGGAVSSRQACIVWEIVKLDDRAVSMAAVQTLSGLAPHSIKPLREVLKRGKSALARANAADALGRIGPTSSEIIEAVPDLAAALKDEAALVRRQAAGALGRLGPKGKAGLPALEAALEDSDSIVRHLVEFAIAAINKEPK